MVEQGPPAIPPITDPDLLHAVSALTHAANSYRKAFLILANLLHASGAGNEEVRDVLKMSGDALSLSDAIINAWSKQLGHDSEDTQDRS